MGCFWGVERLFWQLDGIYSTHVGYSGGDKPNPTYECVCQPPSNTESHHGEVVRVVYFPDKISFESLLATFWNNHDPTQGWGSTNRLVQSRTGPSSDRTRIHSPTGLIPWIPVQGDRSGNDCGPQYRSIIYCQDQSELEKCLKSKELFQNEIGKSSDNTKTAQNIITTEIKINSTFYYAEDRHQQVGLHGPNVPYRVYRVAYPRTKQSVDPCLKYLYKNPNGYCNLRGTGLTCPMEKVIKNKNHKKSNYPLTFNEEVMCQKEHGTCSREVMNNLKWQISHEEADRICCFNRKSAERKGSFQNQIHFKNEFQACTENMDFYDSVTGKMLFSAPKYRTKECV